jgi:hypothetical protein
MSILTFRKTFLAKIQARLNQINVSSANDEQLLIAGALIKQLDAVNQINPISLNTFTVIDTLSGAELDEFALDPDSGMHVISIIKDTAVMAVIARSASTMTAISASAEWVKLINSEASAINIIVNSAVAMDAISSNATARTTIVNTNGAFYTAIKSTNSALAKFVAGCAGLNTANYMTLASLFVLPADVNAIASNAIALELTLSVAPLFDTAKVISMAMAKLIARSAGLNAPDFADMTALSANNAAMTIISTNAMALEAMAKSTVALTAVFAVYTNRTLLWNSVNAITMLFSFAKPYLLSICTIKRINDGDVAYTINKKVLIIQAHSSLQYANGFSYYKHVNGSGTVNSIQVTVASSSITVTPFLTTAANAKASALELSISYSNVNPANYFNYFYIQMEA